MSTDMLDIFAFLIRFAVLFCLAPLIFVLFERSRYGLGLFTLGVFLSVFKTTILRILGVHLHRLGERSDIRGLIVFFQRADLSVYFDLMLVLGTIWFFVEYAQVIRGDYAATRRKL